MLLRLLLALLWAGLLCTPLAAEELSGKISWIYDGDTLQIENIGKVRLLGIDSPESKQSVRDAYYLKKYQLSPKRLRQIAQQAKRFNIEHAKGQQVRLRFDTEKTDKYGRTLAYLYLPDGRLLNRLLIENGLASVFRRYPFRHKGDFLAAEKAAQQAQRGLWQQ